MLIDLITIFPDIFTAPLETGMMRKGRQLGAFSPRVWNLRDFASGRHRQVDDYPYGGGRGMIFKPEPIYEAVEQLRTSFSRIILMSPGGRCLNQEIVMELSLEKHLILIAGRYEGVDERVMNLVDDEISIGDYVLTGGELPALVVIDSIVRQLPGVLSNEVVKEESFVKGRLDFPQYTRPELFRGLEVPKVLRSGNHSEILKWRRQESLIRTLHFRPDLLEEAELTIKEKKFIKDIREEGADYHEHD